MTDDRLAEQQAQAPPLEARCQGCGGWLSTVPAGTPWVRARCGNKRCRLYGDGQMIRFKEAPVASNR